MTDRTEELRQALVERADLQVERKALAARQNEMIDELGELKGRHCDADQAVAVAVRQAFEIERDKFTAARDAMRSAVA